MTERASGTTPNRGEKLTSWKEIAAFFERDVRTVIRWEKELGLPVHRDLKKKRGTVHAYRAELEQWEQQRRLAPEKPERLWKRRAAYAAARRPWPPAAIVFTARGL